MATTSNHLMATLLIVGLLITLNLDLAVGQTGVCYGRNGNNENYIRRMRIYFASQANANANANANAWVQTNVRNYPNVRSDTSPSRSRPFRPPSYQESIQRYLVRWPGFHFTGGELYVTNPAVRAPLLVNIYTYFSFINNKAQINLNYALLQPNSGITVPGGRRHD